ncbi:MAG: hypothetical protein LBV54_02145 [Puniceicoccales bacterium]|jgi:hypothetical protein|nr:hypothetical protein [Puniceicoccales bacterium]
MSHFFSRIPHLALLLLLSLGVPVAAHAQSHFGGDMSYRRLQRDEAAKLLADFRNYRLPGDICLSFTITHVPRNSDKETKYHGTLWGSWQNQGPVFRVELTSADANTPAGAFILQSGPDAALWRQNGSKSERADANATQPICPGLIFTPFELQRPFSYWPDSHYVDVRRILGRPSHVFQMNAPEAFKKAHPEIGHVRLAFDRAYNLALTQAVICGTDGRETRKLEVSDIARVRTSPQDIYLPKELRLFDIASRDKDILSFTHVAYPLQLDRALFDPATVATPATPPGKALFTKLD